MTCHVSASLTGDVTSTSMMHCIFSQHTTRNKTGSKSTAHLLWNKWHVVTGMIHHIHVWACVCVETNRKIAWVEFHKTDWEHFLHVINFWSWSVKVQMSRSTRILTKKDVLQNMSTNDGDTSTSAYIDEKNDSPSNCVTWWENYIMYLKMHVTMTLHYCIL